MLPSELLERNPFSLDERHIAQIDQGNVGTHQGPGMKETYDCVLVSGAIILESSSSVITASSPVGNHVEA
jgi:hypothetical protein